MMATLSQYEQGWRAGFYGREPASADAAYMEGWAVGLRRGDRTRTPRHPPASIDAGLTGSMDESIAPARGLEPARGALHRGVVEHGRYLGQRTL